ncbi:MAG TPA: porin [Oscillatoriales cyanobacterium M4454_W2019_049]|nr:porin [Oscillatoriales cyanobacterium M4454_W2019_049]
MSRSILALARCVLEGVAFGAIALCAVELLGVRSATAQLPELSGSPTAATEDDPCVRAATPPEDRAESERTPSEREKCARAATPPEDRAESEAFSPPAGIPPPMFDTAVTGIAPPVFPPSPVQPLPTPTAETVAPIAPSAVGSANSLTPVTEVDRSTVGSTNSLLESAPPPIFAPPESATGNPSPVVATTSPSLPLAVPTPPLSSGSGNPVPPPPTSLPGFVPTRPNPPATVPISQSSTVPRAIGCGSEEPCHIPHPNENLLSTEELAAALPSRFHFEENAVAADPDVSQVSEVAHATDTSSLGREALTPPKYEFQGVYLYQGDEASARARISGVYPLAPTVALGGSFDLTDGTAFADSQTQGASINELYLVASIPDLPNLRFSLGQLDLTSYFDRNSFAKDGATHFFNSVFQTNPALSRTGIGSRTGLLVNWSVTDDVEAKVAGFSSARRIEDFRIDGLAAELGIRQGNFIVRGTFATARDAGTDDGFREIFQIDRSNGGTGLLSDDREQAYGINAEVFVPEAGLGFFGRYGRYENVDAELGGDTYSFGINVLDLFVPRDRFGIAYGQDLSNNDLRRRTDDELADVFEAFYDFALLPNVRVGFSFQSLNEFSDSILGVRVKTEFDMTPLERN